MSNIGHMTLEEYRWDTMSENQLLARLERTRRRSKLDDFIQLAAAQRNSILEQAGHDRWDFLFMVPHILQRSFKSRIRYRKFKATKSKKRKIIYGPEFRMIR